MKQLNIRILAVACVAIMVCHAVCAQTRTSDYAFFGVSGGYSNLLGNVGEMSVPGRFGLGIKAGYELRHGNFLLRVPVEMGYFTSKCNTDFTIEDIPIKDTRLGDAVMHYQMTSPLKETQRFFMPSAGIEVGYSGNDYQDCRLSGSFYVLAGVRFYHKIDLSNDVSLKYATTATYERYIDDYEDMPNHYYEHHKSTEKENYGIKIGGTATVELGWEWNVNDYDKLKAGARVDIGFTNIMYGIDRKPSEVDPYNVLDVKVCSYYRNEAMEGKYVVPMAFSMAVSYSWNMNRRFGCGGRTHSRRCLPYRRTHRRKRWS